MKSPSKVIVITAVQFLLFAPIVLAAEVLQGKIASLQPETGFFTIRQPNPEVEEGMELVDMQTSPDTEYKGAESLEGFAVGDNVTVDFEYGQGGQTLVAKTIEKI